LFLAHFGHYSMLEQLQIGEKAALPLPAVRREWTG
jgi:hypothetical protein